MKRTAIIDWSGVCNRAWHTIKNRNGWTSQSELEEGRTRIARFMYALKSSIGWDQCFLALDRRDDNKKYWRHYTLDEWYSKSVKRAMCGEHLWAFVDGEWVRNDNGKKAKLTQKAIKEFGDFREVEPSELDETLDIFFGYKFSRANRQWAYETEEATVRKMWGGMADAIAPLIGAKTIRIPGYEADDIAAQFADLKGRQGELVFVGGDSDWTQLILRPNCQFFRIDKGAYVEQSADEIKADLRLKVLTGDTSDCIPPTLTEDGKRITPAKIDELKPSAETLERNKKLIVLNGNAELEALMRQAIKDQRPHDGVTLDSLGVTAIEREWLDEKSAIDKLYAMWSEGVFVPVDII